MAKTNRSKVGKAPPGLGSALNYESLSQLQKALKENAEALQRLCELIAGSGLPKIKPQSAGGKPRVLFEDGLTYITGLDRSDKAFSRFREFLATEEKWSEEQINQFLSTRVDRWPAIERVLSTGKPASDFRRGLGAETPTYLDYGGFYAEELDSLKAVYHRWSLKKRGTTRRKNLPSKKK